jgi:hypothetical protein
MRVIPRQSQFLGHQTHPWLKLHFRILPKPNQKLESISLKKDEDITKNKDKIGRMQLIVANLQRMLFGSKKERFIGVDKAQLLLAFEDFASEEALNDPN